MMVGSKRLKDEMRTVGLASFVLEAWLRTQGDVPFYFSAYLGFFHKELFKIAVTSLGLLWRENISVPWDLLVSDVLTLLPDLCGTPVNQPEP